MNKILNNKILRSILAVAVICSMFVLPGLINELLEFLKIGNHYISSIISLSIYASLIVLLFLPELIQEFKIFKNNIKNSFDNGFKYWLLGLIIMMVSNIIINLIIFKGDIALNEELNRQTIAASPLYYTIFSTVILGPIIEELLFRKSIDKIFKNKLYYIITSGVIFGFMHVTVDLSNVLNLLYIIPYGALGVMFALMNTKTKTVFTSIMMHSIHNLITCILILMVI